MLVAARAPLNLIVQIGRKRINPKDGTMIIEVVVEEEVVVVINAVVTTVVGHSGLRKKAASRKHMKLLSKHWQMTLQVMKANMTLLHVRM